MLIFPFYLNEKGQMRRFGGVAAPTIARHVVAPYLGYFRRNIENPVYGWWLSYRRFRKA